MQHVTYCCVVQWETAHDGLTCEQFATWKKDNDLKLQAQGLAAHLNKEGIGRKLGDVASYNFILFTCAICTECPDCKFKYALAKGGCMHFKCKECLAEFCSGCGDLFKKVVAML